MKSNTCCFLGSRRIIKTNELLISLYSDIERLIVDEKVDTFLFGSKSEFDSLCLEIVTEIKEKYPYIKRVYVRAEYPIISDEYKDYLLKSYEHTYYPQNIMGAGKAVYVERNCEMIDKSDLCVIYFNDGYFPPRRKNSWRDLTDYQPKSGTGIAYKYAVQKKRTIINLAEDTE